MREEESITGSDEEENDVLSEYYRSIHVVKDEESVIKNNNEYKEDLLQDRPSYERMGDEIWAKFHEKDVQDLLSRMCTGFISRYVQLAQKIDFSSQLAWDRKDEYLRDLYDAVSSPQIRPQVVQKVSEDEKREVREAEKDFPDVDIVSNDPIINQLKIKLWKYAKVEIKDISFLLLGESGTGKELFANLIHKASGRKGKFVIADLGGISEDLIESELFGHVKGAFTGALKDKKGRFEQAHGGTIFLDEVGNLPLRLQPKLLRVIQEREIQRVGADKTIRVDVKIVLATNKDLDKEVKKRRFMHDLYQRFKRPNFLIPPLRQRKGDIPLLVPHFIEKYDVKRKEEPDLSPIRMTSECMELLVKYEWNESNIRELQIVILYIMGNRAGGESREDITPSDLPSDILEVTHNHEEKKKLKKNLPGNMKVTKEEIIYWMAKRENNKSQVARDLGVCYKTILRRWKKLHP
jgi:transcriptional regulator with PAS, ATPase and Fis domain